MTSFDVGMKVYSNDWYLKYNLSYEDAARMLADWGVTFVLAQSRVLPMADTAVKSEVPPELANRFAAYDDRKFRDALGKMGIEYWAASLMFFDPQALVENPELQAVGSDGRVMEKIDWYVGIPPSMESHVEHKTALFERAVKVLEPDGVFLAFMRWPNFWELWMERNNRRDFHEYSYDAHTLLRFCNETGVELPSMEPDEAATWIEENARSAWTDWKCDVVEGVIGKVKAACQNIVPGTKIMLNTVPFGKDEFDGAEEKVYGQRFETLAEVVDVFEVMTYHQILKRPTSWIGEIGIEVKKRSGRKTVCTLQASPLYTEGVHAAENRSHTLDIDEFEEAVKSAEEQTGIDGIVVFTWTDFLDQVINQKDNRRIDIIRAAKARREGR
jgi:hypothetical protein